MRVLISAIITTIIGILTAYSQDNVNNETAAISGTVTESKTGEFIIGATVALYRDTTESPVSGAYTNKYGFYSIPGVRQGGYYLSISSVGFGKKWEAVTVEDTDIRLDVKLSQHDISMEEVLVEAERGNDTRKISSVNISPEMVNKAPSLGGEHDIFRTLQLLPGVQQSTELSSGLYIRGGSPDQNLTILDGVVVYNPSHLGGFLSSFNSDAIKDINLIKGAFPAEYGGRLSSVIDMTMKEGSKEKITGAGGISLISSRLTVEGPIGEDVSFMLSGRRMYIDVITDLLSSDDDYVIPYYFYDLNAKLNYKLGENDRLFLSGYFGRDVITDPDDGDDDEFQIDWGNSTFNLRWMHIASANLFTNFSLIYTNYLFESELIDNYDGGGTEFSTYSGIEDLMFRGEAQYFPSKDHVIKAGLEVTRHEFISKATGQSYDIRGFARQDVNAVEAALYIQDEWQAGDRLATNLGVRGYYFQEGSYFSLEPRLSVSYALTGNMNLTGAVAMTNQFLHLIVKNDITLPTDLWFPSTDEIQPGRAWQAVIGLNSTLFDDTWYGSVEVYAKDMRNLYEYKDSVEFEYLTPLNERFTQGRGEAYGIEFFLNKRIGRFNGWIGYTLAWTTRIFPELNGGKAFSPRYDRRNDINIVANYNISDSWEVGAAFVYGTGQAFTMPTGVFYFGNHDLYFEDNYYDDEKYHYTERNGARLPSYHRLDLNFMHRYEWFGLPFELSINLYNVYNRKNPFSWYIDQDYNDETDKYEKQLKQLTLFPLIPTIGLNFKF
ncbi:MAG: TonB-dependent receptor [Bacteroidota bacterium]